MNTSASSIREEEPDSSLPYTVCVEGNIGSGKTTFLNKFTHVAGVEVIQEPVERWTNLGGENILGHLYTDPATWGMAFQTLSMLTMLEGHLQSDGSAVKVMERSLFSARNCFIESMAAKGILLPGMKNILDKWHEFIDSYHQVKVDTFVYLRTTPVVAYERMQARARTEEANVTLDHLTQLHLLHEAWLGWADHDQDGVRIITINADQTLVESEGDYQRCIDEIVRSANLINAEL